MAEDWLEEEEDELQLYWERFDENKSGNIKQEDSSHASKIHDDEEDDSLTLTTEQRLDRYYDRRGINKRREREHITEIEHALKNARKAATPEEAILFLEKVQPWLQINSKLGGTALLELAIVLWQRDGIPDEALCEELLGNSHVRREVQLLLKNGPQERQEETSLWQGLSFFNDPNGRRRGEEHHPSTARSDPIRYDTIDPVYYNITATLLNFHPNFHFSTNTFKNGNWSILRRKHCIHIRRLQASKK